MKKSDFFAIGEVRSGLKIYSIVKRERNPKRLLGPAPNFSWPPRQKRSAVHDSAAKRDEGENK